MQVSSQSTSTDTALPVMEQFYTVQGEGAFTGTAAYFIRLAGCDVGCVWCDVKESWEASDHPSENISEIIEMAGKAEPDMITLFTELIKIL